MLTIISSHNRYCPLKYKKIKNTAVVQRIKWNEGNKETKKENIKKKRQIGVIEINRGCIRVIPSYK